MGRGPRIPGGEQLRQADGTAWPPHRSVPRTKGHGACEGAPLRPREPESRVAALPGPQLGAPACGGPAGPAPAPSRRPPCAPFAQFSKGKRVWGKAGIPHFNSDYGLIQHRDHVASGLSAECRNILMELGYRAHVGPTVPTRRSLWLPDEPRSAGRTGARGTVIAGRGVEAPRKTFPLFY